ncbi:FAD-binding domain-containing [Pyrrhoderma noxium]|uniref:FAD-binding domain-containing n=1 Tax=Pyrrhoderma noxium TaxID=2282107 RepID=A0A286UKZ8_9AGAM|nr:FAD-binding domain-containing [Pyrrhoderma noxium]
MLRYLSFSSLLIVALSSLSCVDAARLDTRNSDLQNGAVTACSILKEKFPDLVAFPGADQYASDIDHWAGANNLNATCSIEPASPEDVSKIIKIIGRGDIRSPFAVKSGGHAYAAGHSSTLGLTWDQVYKQITPLGITIAGGRVSGVGVGGLSLGGGYSWKTNQYGLTIDNIVSHEVVLPGGEIVHSSNETNSDLFFGLKGGLNNFGIVTHITYKSLPQDLIYGGKVTYSYDVIDQISEVVAYFSEFNTDVKAQIGTVNSVTEGEFVMNIEFFYDAPTNYSEVFEPFLSIPSISSDIKLRTFDNYVSSFGNDDFGIGKFGFISHTVPISKYPVPLIQVIVSEQIALEQSLRTQYPNTTFIVHMDIEPFINTNAHSTGGAYPHPSSRPLTPFEPEVYYSVDENSTINEKTTLYNALATEIKNYSRTVQNKAVELGVSLWDDPLYPNYSLGDTPLELLYGDNVPRLKEIAAKYDPEKVMTLTNGFHVQ